MKNFKEKQVQELYAINGGAQGPKTNISLNISFTIVWDNFFDGSSFKKGGAGLNEFDKVQDKPVLSA